MTESPYGKLSETPSTLTQTLCPGDPCNLDWGDHGGCCCDFIYMRGWSFDTPEATRCDRCLTCLHMYCCFCVFGWCTSARVFASSMDQSCAIVNHCWLAYAFPCCVGVLSRHNLRKKLKIGGSGWCGDILAVWFCPCCSALQMYRSLPHAGWDWTETVSDTEWMVTPWILAT